MITLIAAMDRNGGIGFENKLPWPRIDRDMKLFREATKGKAVIMGRKTFESLDSKPLPGRLNIVISSNHNGDHEVPVCATLTSNTSLSLVNSVAKAVEVAEVYCGMPGDTFVIGGASIYNQCLPLAGRIMLTRVEGEYEADTFWTPDLGEWIMVRREDVREDGKRVCLFDTYERPKL